MVSLSHSIEAARSLAWYEVLALIIISAIIYHLLIIIYRLTLHPLAHYPGPLLQRISTWPLVYHCYRGDRHLWELQNHSRYGPIVRYTPNSLSISSPAALTAIHGPKANVKKGEWYKTLDISAGAPSVQMERDRTEHAMRRRFLGPAFSERALREAEGLINVSARKLVDGLLKCCQRNSGTKEKEWSTSQNFSDWATWFAFDFISDLGYGTSFGMLDDEKNRWIPGVLKSASRFLYYFGYLPFIELVRPLLGTKVQDYVGGQEAADSLRYTNLANGRLAERIALEKKLSEKGVKSDGEDGKRKDTFHYLINAKDPVTSKAFTTEQLQADSALIIAAGSDGVGITLSACLFYLLTNPSTLETLTSEIRSAFSSTDEIRNPKLGNLTYLQACIDETLRLNPPKASSLPRDVLKGGITIEDTYIPAGITVGVPLYVLQHDSSIFPDPFTFRPERWIISSSSSLSGTAPEDLSAAKSAFAPFLIGPMNCIGRNMAYIALKLALAHLLLECDVRIAGKLVGGGKGHDPEEGRRREGEYQMVDWILGFRDGPVVEVRRRG